jgi:hypothetical protein
MKSNTKGFLYKAGNHSHEKATPVPSSKATPSSSAATAVIRFQQCKFTRWKGTFGRDKSRLQPLEAIIQACFTRTGSS